MADSPTTRASLIVRLHDRNDALAWDEFVGMYSPLVRRVAIARGMQDADANEVVQEVFMAIVKAIPEYKTSARSGSFRKWLTTIARNKTINRLTRQPVEVIRRADNGLLHELVPDRSSTHGGAKELQQLWQHQMFVLAAQEIRTRVQPATWTAFWKTAVEGLACEIVSKELGMSLGSVYVARSRVLGKIREWVHMHTDKWEADHHDC